MKCKTFKDKLPEYIDRTLSRDIHETMSNHLKDCDVCRKLYDEEKEMGKLFAETLKNDDIKFNSSRQQVIKSINRNLYGKSILKKIKYSFIRNRVQLVCTGVILITIFTTGAIWRNIKYSNLKFSYSRSTNGKAHSINTDKKSNDRMKTADIKEAKDEPNSQISLKASDYNNTFQYTKVNLTSDAYVPKFKKEDVEVSYDKSVGTPWEKSPDGELQFSIYGKGQKAIEEGEAYLLFKNKRGNMWKIYIADNKKQYTPMFAKWFDNNSLLVTVGLGYGTVTAGGDLFLINADDGKAVNIYNAYTSSNNRNQVVTAYRQDNYLKLKLRKYDDAMNKFKEENESLYFNEVNLSSSDTDSLKNAEDLWQQPLRQLSKDIDKGDQQSINKLFDSDLLLESSNNVIKDLNQTEKFDLNRIIDITPSVDTEELENKYPYIKVYILDANVDIQNEGYVFKNGRNYLYAIVAAKNEFDTPIIYNIKELSHN